MVPRRGTREKSCGRVQMLRCRQATRFDALSSLAGQGRGRVFFPTFGDKDMITTLIAMCSWLGFNNRERGKARSPFAQSCAHDGVFQQYSPPSSQQPPLTHKYIPCIPRMATIAHQMGNWELSQVAPSEPLPVGVRNRVFTAYKKATELEDDNYKAWHSWAMVSGREIRRKKSGSRGRAGSVSRSRSSSRSRSNCSSGGVAAAAAAAAYSARVRFFAILRDDCLADIVCC